MRTSRPIPATGLATRWAAPATAAATAAPSVPATTAPAVPATLDEALSLGDELLALPDDELEDVDGARMLVGAEAVHRRLVAWLGDLGLRPAAPAPEGEP